MECCKAHLLCFGGCVARYASGQVIECSDPQEVEHSVGHPLSPNSRWRAPRKNGHEFACEYGGGAPLSPSSCARVWRHVSVPTHVRQAGSLLKRGGLCAAWRTSTR